MDWLKLDKKTIFEGKDERGNRYLSQFLSDYKEIFNPDEINAGCKNCLNEYYSKMLKHLNTMSSKKSKSTNSGYALKPKYEGIPAEFGSRTLVYNHNITDEIAEELLKKHPRGKELFAVIPVKTEETPTAPPAGFSDEAKELLKLTREDLNVKALDAGIDSPDEFTNKLDLVNEILKSTKQSDEGKE